MHKNHSFKDQHYLIIVLINTVFTTISITAFSVFGFLKSFHNFFFTKENMKVEFLGTLGFTYYIYLLHENLLLVFFS